jgi:hypothetical protein
MVLASRRVTGLVNIFLYRKKHIAPNSRHAAPIAKYYTLSEDTPESVVT